VVFAVSAVVKFIVPEAFKTSFAMFACLEADPVAQTRGFSNAAVAAVTW